MKTSALVERQQLQQNLGLADRQIRAITGTLMLAVPVFAVPGTLGHWSIVILASIPVLLTAIIGWDPLYAVMNKSTYKSHSEDIHQRHWTRANLGIIDRGIRLGAGLLMLTALMGMQSMTGGMALTLMAIPLIVTAIIAWDPLYAAMSLNSFGSRNDVEAAEPGVNKETLAEYYEFPQPQANSTQYPKAA
jgi:hypothetical protein